MKRSKAQLNAISRSYTQKARKEAINTLWLDHNIVYDEFVRMFNYGASPVRLLTSIRFNDEATINKVIAYHESRKGERLI